MKPNYPDEKPGVHEPVSGQSIELEWEAAWRELIGAIRRRRYIFLTVFGCIVIGAIVYSLSSTRFYTAATYVSIDAHHKEPISERQTAEPATVVGSAEVDSQVEVIKSVRIATNVVRKLELHKSPEFVSKEPSFAPITWIKERISSFASWLLRNDSNTADVSDEDKNAIIEHRVVEQFASRLNVVRAGLTYVVEIDFIAKDPKLASAIANAVGEAYIAEQLEARYGTLRRANAWLFERIKALRQRQIESERAVADFRAQNNIVDTGGVGSRTVGNQQLADLNTNLTTARTQTAEAFAKWQQLQHVVNAGDIDAPGLTDAANNPVIQRLHEQLGELVRRRADRVSRVGPGHGVIVLLNSEITQVRQLILSELRTIEGSVRNEYEIAKNREDQMTQKLNLAIGENTKATMSTVQLRDLQREADANRALYEAFLGRYASASEQQNFPISEARILSEATTPLDPSHPKKLIILVIGIVAGSVLGLASALIKDRMEEGFRSRRQVQSQIGMPLIAVAPRASPQAFRPSKSARRKLPMPNLPKDLPESRRIARSNQMMSIAVDSVLSRYADALRSVRFAAERATPNENGRIIGVVSSIPHEGKSTLAANLAQLLADSGERVLLVDADFRRATLTSELAPPNSPGAADVILGEKPLDSVTLFDPDTGLEFLCRGEMHSASEITELATSKAFAKFVEQSRAVYTWTILDLPPLAPVIDTHAVASVVDGFILVIEWGATPRTVVIQSLEANEVVRRRLIGCVFNKVDMEKMAQYEPHMKQSYYSTYYDDGPNA
jgi:polysaccharide biosynthesis transport protein